MLTGVGRHQGVCFMRQTLMIQLSSYMQNLLCLATGKVLLELDPRSEQGGV